MRLAKDLKLQVKHYPKRWVVTFRWRRPHYPGDWFTYRLSVRYGPKSRNPICVCPTESVGRTPVLLAAAARYCKTHDELPKEAVAIIQLYNEALRHRAVRMRALPAREEW